MDILNQINLDYVIGVLIIFALFSVKIWLLPYLKSKGVSKQYLELVEQALLIGGTAFRSNKTKEIFFIAVEIVNALEALDNLDSIQKHTQAVGELAGELLNKLNIELNKDSLDRIIHLAVAFMGEE